eukprot:5379897-Prymnesium_polylepis.1
MEREGARKTCEPRWTSTAHRASGDAYCRVVLGLRGPRTFYGNPPVAVPGGGRAGARSLTPSKRLLVLPDLTRPRRPRGRTAVGGGGTHETRVSLSGQWWRTAHEPRRGQRRKAQKPAMPTAVQLYVFTLYYVIYDA